MCWLAPAGGGKPEAAAAAATRDSDSASSGDDAGSDSPRAASGNGASAHADAAAPAASTAATGREDWMTKPMGRPIAAAPVDAKPDKQLEAEEKAAIAAVSRTNVSGAQPHNLSQRYHISCDSTVLCRQACCSLSFLLGKILAIAGMPAEPHSCAAGKTVGMPPASQAAICRRSSHHMIDVFWFPGTGTGAQPAVCRQRRQRQSARRRSGKGRHPPGRRRRRRHQLAAQGAAPRAGRRR